MAKYLQSTAVVPQQGGATIKVVVNREGVMVAKVKDEEGFERQSVPYAPSFKELEAASGVFWHSDVTEDRFKRRLFEHGDGEILTKLHAPMRFIWFLEVMNELEDMTCLGATIREGVAWAQTHDVNDYPSDIVIALLGSAWQFSGGNLSVPYLYRRGGRWCLRRDLFNCSQWDAVVQFLAVRRKILRP